MNFQINTEEVTAQLTKMDEAIDELRTILANMESDISKGWDSDRALSVVSPKIDEVKTSIEKMQLCTNRVRGNVAQYVSNVTSADTAGSITGANEAKG